MTNFTGTKIVIPHTPTHSADMRKDSIVETIDDMDRKAQGGEKGSNSNNIFHHLHGYHSYHWSSGSYYER